MAGVIVALDRPDARAAFELVDALGSEGTHYKVGLELFTAAGPGVVRRLRERGKRVFLDLKLHDIPNTVAGAVRVAANLDVDLLTVHAAGGSAMLEAARDAAAGRTRIVAVTVLTSMASADDDTLAEPSVGSALDEVARLAERAVAAGLDAVVASAREVGRLRAVLGTHVLLVTPGIRPRGVEAGDQRRIATPAEAVRAGADYLVVGRAVSGARDPAAALAAVLSEVAAAASASGSSERRESEGRCP